MCLRQVSHDKFYHSFRSHITMTMSQNTNINYCHENIVTMNKKKKLKNRYSCGFKRTEA